MVLVLVLVIVVVMVVVVVVVVTVHTTSATTIRSVLNSKCNLMIPIPILILILTDSRDQTFLLLRFYDKNAKKLYLWYNATNEAPPKDLTFVATNLQQVKYK